MVETSSAVNLLRITFKTPRKNCDILRSQFVNLNRLMDQDWQSAVMSAPYFHQNMGDTTHQFGCTTPKAHISIGALKWRDFACLSCFVCHTYPLKFLRQNNKMSLVYMRQVV